MNGPFPPDTWAAPALTENTSLFRRVQAKTALTKSTNRPEQLTLKFVDDPLSNQACGMIKKQLGEIGVNIVLAPMNAADFNRDVMLEHNYELAYMPYDFASDMYSLRGLFDNRATGRGGRNFLGYQPDTRFGQLQTAIDQTRDFSKNCEGAHGLHAHFEDQMPFIPLWQLDFHMVVSKKLETVPPAAELDAQSIFESVEEWRLNR